MRVNIVRMITYMTNKQYKQKQMVKNELLKKKNPTVQQLF